MNYIDGIKAQTKIELVIFGLRDQRLSTWPLRLWLTATQIHTYCQFIECVTFQINIRLIFIIFDFLIHRLFKYFYTISMELRHKRGSNPLSSVYENRHLSSWQLHPLLTARKNHPYCQFLECETFKINITLIVIIFNFLIQSLSKFLWNISMELKHRRRSNSWSSVYETNAFPLGHCASD